MQLKAILCRTSTKKTVTHTIKLLLTYYLNISEQAANLSDCRIESNRKKIDSVARIESNRIETFFCPNWNALVFTCIGAPGTPPAERAPRYKVFTGFPLQLIFAKVKAEN